MVAAEQAVVAVQVDLLDLVVVAAVVVQQVLLERVVVVVLLVLLGQVEAVDQVEVAELVVQAEHLVLQAPRVLMVQIVPDGILREYLHL